MADVKPILQDGLFHARLDELKNKNGDPPWADQLVKTDQLQGWGIC